MPVIRGRLVDRKNATIELDDRKIRVITRGGFFGGKSSNSVISLDDVKSVENETGVKPYPDAAVLKLTYSEGELVFFSINKAPLQSLAEEAARFVEKRARLLVEMEKEYGLDREAHVELLFLNLELADALMALIVKLHGSVDWEAVEGLYTQVMRVNQDRDNLVYMRPAHLSLSRLAEGVEDRSVEVIKAEVYDLLFVLHESCAEKAKHREPWFNTGLHKLFLEALMTLWSRRLETVTGESSGEALEKSEMRLNELRLMVVNETGEEEEPVLDIQSGFSDIQSILYGWVEALQNVGFMPGEELERRLAS